MKNQSCYFVEILIDENNIEKITICKVKDDSETKISMNGCLRLNLDNEKKDLVYWKNIEDYFNN